jgi:hypothetical protein
MPTLAGQLECATLAAWTDQAPLLDVARLYDVLREGLTAAYRDYRDARARGWRGQGDAGKALCEVLDLVALLDVCADEFEWRRVQYMATGRLWPLAGMVT